MAKRDHNIFYACVFIVSLVIFPCWTVNAGDDSSKTGDANRGAKEWANNCSRCHNFRDPKEFRDDLWAPVVQHMRVRAGLTGQQARDIIAFLQSSNYSVVPPETATVETIKTSGLTGEEIFSQTCVACHGEDGKGVFPGMPDLRTRLTKSDEVLLQSIENGLQTSGAPMAMPPRGGNPDLTKGDMKLVLEYIKSKFK